MHGSRIIGRDYTVIEKIAETNYAEVFKVEDMNHDIFALKIARVSDDLNNELIAREYSILSQLVHPCIVKTFDFDINTDGRLYIKMEYIDGEPIDRYFRQFSEDFATAIMQLLSALNTLRSRGLTHDDLKPEHILYVAETKRVVLIDFGFANITSTLSHDFSISELHNSLIGEQSGRPKTDTGTTLSGTV